MYLKALEIQGFKSFPDKVRLSFEKEVTAIVGPNGSGKSNISDAISWVLGEQRTKALRGSKMEDVIFGGTAERARLGFAQVSLILDNSAGAFQAEPGELSVTRRYYRSGESEYFINKKSVRLKDVNSLFMDTGLGRDGYSMIGQGRVDEILSARSTDRREVFEEAAGISRFRYRREEAQSRLDKTEDSLLRINDKISELELSVEPLRKQAQAAKKYLSLRDELRGLEISLWMESLDRLAQKSAALREEAEDASKRLEAAKAELQALYDRAGSFAESFGKYEQESEKLRREADAVNALAAERENELAVINANISAGEQNAQRLENELREQEKRATELGGQTEQYRRRAREIDEELAEISAELIRLESESAAAARKSSEKESGLAELNGRINEAAGAAAAARARLEALESSGEEMLSSAESARLELARFDERLNAGMAELDECEKTLGDRVTQAKESSNRIDGLRRIAENRAAASAELEKRQREVQLEENRVSSRAALLGEMKKEYEGFSRAVKTVMQEKRGGGLKNIHGTVAELIRVPDEYSVAIETALNDSVQNIIVEREEDGKAAISLLKRRDAGRATFLPISSMNGSELRDTRILSQPGMIDIASRLVDCDGRYMGVIRSLLGRVVVAEDLDAAIAAARKGEARVKIVTLDGQVMNVGGSMTGGSAARSVGIISRANELERLLARREELEKELKRLSAELSESRRAETEARYEAERAEEGLRGEQDDILRLKTELEQRRVLVASLKETRRSMEAGLGETEQRAGRNRDEKAYALAEAERQERAEAALRAEAEKLAAERESAAATSSRLKEEFGAAKNSEAALRSEREATIRAVSEWESLASSLAAEHRRREGEISALRRSGEELRLEAAEKKRQAEELRALAAEGQKRLDEKAAERAALEGQRSGNEKKVREKNEEIVSLERAYAGVDQRRQAADMEEKQLVDRLWESYELSRTAAQRQRQQLESVPKAKSRVSALKRDIAALGTPNIGAIDEFERVNERYTYLTDQRDDILTAKKGLEKIIQDVTREMEEIFTREFDSINEHFKTTFRELFGGGSASLELEDREHVLECGVEIHVQPPGKTQKTLTLLSGGERAFVAIALYFAIMKVRPTPFCVLDEIESALDEKNVARFADYLRKVCDRTQFLVITHRRGSMERADVLYGVTMQKGVSKVLSLDLEEALRKY